MSGTVQGNQFKAVLDSMLMGKVLFPIIRSRVEKMSPDKEYPWDDFLQMLNDISKRLPEAALVGVGFKAAQRDHSAVLAHFARVEDALSDFQSVFGLTAKGAPRDAAPRTIDCSANRAVIAVGAQPAAFVEGCLRALVTSYKKTIVQLNHSNQKGTPVIDLTWA